MHGACCLHTEPCEIAYRKCNAVDPNVVPTSALADCFDHCKEKWVKLMSWYPPLFRKLSNVSIGTNRLGASGVTLPHTIQSMCYFLHLVNVLWPTSALLRFLSLMFFPRNISESAVNVFENLPFGTRVARLTAVDKDIGDTVHYEFVGSYNGFTINAGEWINCSLWKFWEFSTP